MPYTVVHTPEEKKEALRLQTQQIANIQSVVNGADKSQCDAGCLNGILRRLIGRRVHQKGQTTALQRLQKTRCELATELEAQEDKWRQAQLIATKAYREGRTSDAVRLLRSAKRLEKTVRQTESAISTLEEHSDVLWQSQVQKQVAAALGSAKSTLKRDKQVLITADGAVDAAMELRDIAEDVGAAISGYSESTYDDDALLAELQSMTTSDTTPAASNGEVPQECKKSSNQSVAGVQFPEAPTSGAESLQHAEPCI